MPTVCPGPTFRRRSDENVVTPAYGSGTTAAGSSRFGTRSTKPRSVTIAFAWSPKVCRPGVLVSGLL